MINYKEAYSDFLLNLALEPEIKELANHYGLTNAQVVRKLEPSICVNRYRNKSIKKISIDCTEKESGIKVYMVTQYTK